MTNKAMTMIPVIERLDDEDGFCNPFRMKGKVPYLLTALCQCGELVTRSLWDEPAPLRIGQVEVKMTCRHCGAIKSVLANVDVVITTQPVPKYKGD